MPKSPFDISYQNKNVEGRIVAALERISEAFRVLLWNEGKEYSLSPIQIQALIFMLHHDEGKRKVSLLAQEFNMTKATISDTIKSLEEKKLIKKRPDDTDSRSYTISLTTKGAEIATKASLFATELHTPISSLSESAKADFLLNLVQIIHHLNKAGIITVQRMCLNCSHFQRHEKSQVHYCKLLKLPLASVDLRIDCPEYQP